MSFRSSSTARSAAATAPAPTSIPPTSRSAPTASRSRRTSRATRSGARGAAQCPMGAITVRRRGGCRGPLRSGARQMSSSRAPAWPAPAAPRRCGPRARRQDRRARRGAPRALRAAGALQGGPHGRARRRRARAARAGHWEERWHRAARRARGGRASIWRGAGSRRTASVDGLEHLVVATGLRAQAPPRIPDGPGVHHLRTLDDAEALRRELRPGARLVVVGAGFVGPEVASSAIALGAM